MIKLQNISKIYKRGNSKIIALDNISLEVKKGQFIAIQGPSGSGKTTLLNIIGLMDSPTNGEYFLMGYDSKELDNNTKSRIRNEIIGFVFQTFNLLPNWNVFENILLPIYYNRDKELKIKRKKNTNIFNFQKGKLNFYKQRAKKIAKFLNIENRLNHLTNELSGGEYQRVAIGRALINQPQLILADEPTGNLDSKTAQKLMNIFTKLNKKGTTIIIVTHNNEVAKYATKQLKIKDGKLINT